MIAVAVPSLLLLTYFVLLFTLYPILDRVYAPNENDLFSTAGRHVIVILGIALSFLVQAAVVRMFMTLVPNGEMAFFVGVPLVLITPPVLGIVVARLAKLTIDRSGASRARLAMNWLGVGSLHGTWANPATLLFYGLFRAVAP
jgi:hypothetical protein